MIKYPNPISYEVCEKTHTQNIIEIQQANMNIKITEITNQYSMYVYICICIYIINIYILIIMVIFKCNLSREQIVL